MSLWKVRHGLTPPVEYALVALTVAYGLFAIYLATIKPLEVAFVSDVRNLPTQVPLVVDSWERCENVPFGYTYAIPPGWVADGPDSSRLRIARYEKQLLTAGRAGREGITVEVVPLEPEQGVEDLAFAEFQGRRPALYDVGVDGRPALFVIDFRGSKIDRQSVYVPAEGRAYVIRGGATDPAVFSAFISSIEFVPES